MKIINQQFKITYQYPVYFTTHLFHQDNTVLKDFLTAHSASFQKKVLFVLDEGMMIHHPQLKDDIRTYIRQIAGIALAGTFVTIPGGEEAKNDEGYLKKIVEAVNQYGIDRHSFIIAVGGGAVLDLAGYAAAITHRGIRHIRIPTTVLSQNDSGVGVKNGINHLGKKNFLGTFSPPYAVFNDTHFLSTLDDRNWRSGISEAVKVALIRDAEFFEWLETNADKLVHRDKGAMEYLVYQCASLHLQHIASGDPFESGSSRPLDFGHWSAHKLEQLTGFSLLHGEAVAIGIALDVLYSQQIGWLKQEETQRILSLLEKLQFELYHPLLEDASLTEGLKEFREHLGGELTIMLLRGIGHGENIHEMNTGIIRNCINDLKEDSKDHKNRLDSRKEMLNHS
jgi:3-dehydroquinate synthase